ncbi:MAG TPA: hypothetical protein VMC85_01890 [Desulfomonilaceae bacterium]|nr:hypothetical protein [Desulfomonilaceae bacterium]
MSILSAARVELEKPLFRVDTRSLVGLVLFSTFASRIKTCLPLEEIANPPFNENCLQGNDLDLTSFPIKYFAAFIRVRRIKIGHVYEVELFPSYRHPLGSNQDWISHSLTILNWELPGSPGRRHGHTGETKFRAKMKELARPQHDSGPHL